MTIEDPIEFVYTDKTATINQREVGKDTGDFTMALRAALRQDPDVILMGEMRDIETIDIALHAAETGHLVFSTLHTNDAAQTMDRIKNTFPAEAQSHIQEMLALCLVGVVSQRLVPKADGTGRVAAIEVMVNSPAIAELIEKGEIGKIIQAMKKAGAYYRMQTMNQALAAFVQADVITEEVAAATSQTPDDLRLILKGFSGGGTTVGSSVKTEVAKAEDKDEKPAEEEKKDAEPKEEGDDKRKFKIKRGF
jgi:twitching motility protein PilT